MKQLNSLLFDKLESGEISQYLREFDLRCTPNDYHLC